MPTFFVPLCGTERNPPSDSEGAPYAVRLRLFGRSNAQLLNVFDP